MTSTATIKKVGSFTQARAAYVCGQSGVVKLGETAEGVEIYDRRPLASRLSNPIKGRGVIRYFSDSHFVVSPAKFQELAAA